MQPENRAIGMGFVLGAFALSSCIAPFIATAVDDYTIYCIYAVLNISHFLYVFAFIPETLPAELRSNPQTTTCNPFKICAILNRFAARPKCQ